MVHRVPNDRLRGPLAEARWTGEAMARAVNALSAEAGLTLRYQRASVSQWLSGIRPRPPIPEMVAEGLSRRLRRRVTAEETGLVPAAIADSAQQQETDVAGTLAEVEAGSLYRLEALDLPGWDERASGPGAPSTGDRTSVVGWPEIDSAKQMIRLFADADSAFGAGSVRPALTGYLRTTIAQWVRSGAAPSVRAELLTTASRLAYLCAFTYFDDEMHGTAQHYYLLSTRLATEAGNALCYAVALRGLSVQARLLGHRRHAVHLAEAAVRAAPGGTPAHTSRSSTAGWRSPMLPVAIHGQR